MHCVLWMILLYIVLGAGLPNVRGQGPGASGNAMDLAKMNMQLMNANSKCPIPMCQSVCQVMEPRTGCYVCNNACTAGSLMEPNMAGQMNPLGTGGGGYQGCDSSWMQCPVRCKREYNTMGCLRCICTQTASVHTGTHPSRPAEATSHSSALTGRTTTTITSTSSTTSTSKRPTTKPVQAFSTPMRVTTDVPPITPTQNHINSMLAQPTAIYITPFNSTSKTQYGVTVDSMAENQQKVVTEAAAEPDMKFLIVIGVLSILLSVALSFGLVSFIAWRRSLHNLRKNKDELYFVHKAYRQDSTARLRDNDMADPVYTHVQERPEVPPRSPPISPLTPTENGTQFLLRTVSATSDTSLKEVADETRHDYLELI